MAGTRFGVCHNAVRATTADLLKYDRLIQKKQTIQQAQAMEDREGSAARVQEQIRAFRRQ